MMTDRMPDRATDSNTTDRMTDGKMIDSKTTAIERHPLQPFLPAEARVLMLGSFPPPHARWSMEFYYPNFIK